MAEGKKELSVVEVRRTIATALAAAFGFVIAPLWRDVVTGVLDVAGVTLVPGAGLGAIGIFVLTAVLVSVVMVAAIVIVSRWGGTE